MVDTEYYYKPFRGYLILAVLVPLTFEIGLILHIVLTNAYGQEQQQQQNQTATKTYLDPEGVYSIKYPIEWTVEPRSNRFKDTELTFQMPQASNYSLGATNSLSLGNFDMSELQQQQNNNGNESTEQQLKNFVEMTRQTASYIPNSNFKVVEEVECTNYKISNNTACSVLMSGPSQITMSSDSAVLIVLSKIPSSNKEIQFQYQAEFDNFDKYLPAVKDTIKSFKLIKCEKV